MQKKKLIILIAAVACIAVVAVTLVVTLKQAPAPASEPTPAPADEPTPVPTNEETWHLFDNVWGQGDHTTSVFTINHPWRINWNYSSTKAYRGVFGVMAYAKFEIEWHAIAIDGSTITNSTSGVLSVNQTGAFYLRVIANDWVAWRLEIEEYR